MNMLNDSRKYIEDLIYENNYYIRTPTSKDDINYQIQTLISLYKENPDWDDNFKEDIKEYVKKCIDKMDKV